MQRQQLFLEVQDCGATCARSVPGGMGSGVGEVAEAVGANTITAFGEKWPAWADAVSAAEVRQEGLAGTRPSADRWHGLLEGRKGKTRKDYMQETFEQQRRPEKCR